MFAPPELPAQQVAPPAPGVDIQSIIARLQGRDLSNPLLALLARLQQPQSAAPAGFGGPMDEGDNPELSLDNIGAVAAGHPRRPPIDAVTNTPNQDMLRRFAHAKHMAATLKHLRRLRPAAGDPGFAGNAPAGLRLPKQHSIDPGFEDLVHGNQL